MGEQYFDIKRKLEELGYNYALSVESVPLVECILADLLQTTRSLQHYMDLSKQALIQRDSLMMEAEPYKCDNRTLIQENNKLHQDNILLKEEIFKLNRDYKRKIKSLTEELSNKELLVSKLQHDLRDISLRNICADTLSSRNRSKKKDSGDGLEQKLCTCSDKVNQTDDLTEIKKKVSSLSEQNEEFKDEILLLKEQVDHRDREIQRLKILLEGGRTLKAVQRDYEKTSDEKVKKMSEHIKELEMTIDSLKNEIEVSLEKQHEAMVRALSLADKNKTLQEELEKVDKLALRVEDDCNKKLNSMMKEIESLQTKNMELTIQNSELKAQQSFQNSSERLSRKLKMEESLNNALKEKDSLQKEVHDLAQLNKSLHDKIISLAEVIDTFHYKFTNEIETFRVSPKCSLKGEFQKLIQDERNKYEIHVKNMQEKLNETISLFKQQLKDKDASPRFNTLSENAYIREIHNKLCESEHKILMLKKENEEMKSKIYNQEDLNKHKYQDIINHLNVENSELSKENIFLSQQLSHYKGLNFKNQDRGDSSAHDLMKLNEKVNEMNNKIQLVQKDKMEYNMRYKEAMDLVDKLKKDLMLKQKEIENLQEENSSYKITNRTKTASSDQIRDECIFLREELKKIQSDIIKEKTITNQIRNIQQETERSNTEVQNDLLNAQKKLSLSRDTIESLEKKCKELQSEIVSLKNNKCDLLENIKSIDKERDKLVIELDNKTETISMLEQKVKMQTFETNKLEKEIADLTRKLSLNRVSEHKVEDYESQIGFLNSEILRLNQQYDTAIIENKHLQNNLADANSMLKLTKIELEKSRKDVDSLRQQLQHYVAEIRRIEELLSQKEAERSDMLEQFASLSVEANILENTNHSLESESASKSMQLQSYVSKIQSLEEQLSNKDHIIDSQTARLAAMTCKVTTLESEIKLITEEKLILQQNITYLKQMCNNFQDDQTFISKNNDSETIRLESKIRLLSNTKGKLETEKQEMTDKINTLEKLLSNARKEVVELKIALQDATTETKSLQKEVKRFKSQEIERHKNFSSPSEMEIAEISEERIEELNIEEHDSDSDIDKKISFFKHSSTI